VLIVGSWADIAVIYNGGFIATSGTMRLLVNGSARSLTFTGGYNGQLNLLPDQPVRIACDNFITTRYFRGDIAFIMAFDGILPDAAIAQLFRDPWGVTNPANDDPYLIESNAVPVTFQPAWARSRSLILGSGV
jgi:hypothetical protein